MCRRRSFFSEISARWVGVSGGPRRVAQRTRGEGRGGARVGQVLWIPRPVRGGGGPAPEEPGARPRPRGPTRRRGGTREDPAALPGISRAPRGPPLLAGAGAYALRTPRFAAALSPAQETGGVPGTSGRPGAGGLGMDPPSRKGPPGRTRGAAGSGERRAEGAQGGPEPAALFLLFPSPRWPPPPRAAGGWGVGPARLPGARGGRRGRASAGAGATGPQPSCGARVHLLTRALVPEGLGRTGRGTPGVRAPLVGPRLPRRPGAAHRLGRHRGSDTRAHTPQGSASRWRPRPRGSFPVSATGASEPGPLPSPARPRPPPPDQTPAVLPGPRSAPTRVPPSVDDSGPGSCARRARPRLGPDETSGGNRANLNEFPVSFYSSSR